MFNGKPLIKIFLSTSFLLFVIGYINLGGFTTNAGNLKPKKRGQANSNLKAERYFNAAHGIAFSFEIINSEITYSVLTTSLPAFRVFGVTSDFGAILYSPLKDGAPSGDLYIESLRTKQRTKISKH